MAKRRKAPEPIERKPKIRIPGVKLVYTKTYGSPLVPRHFIRNDMLSCYDVKNKQVTATVLHIRVDGIEGEMEAIMAALPEDKQGIPPIRNTHSGIDWKMPNRTPKIRVEAADIPDDDEMDLGDAL